jgi:hypothetical protein
VTTEAGADVAVSDTVTAIQRAMSSRKFLTLTTPFAGDRNVGTTLCGDTTQQWRYL